MHLNCCTPACLTAHAAACVLQERHTSYNFHITARLWGSQYFRILVTLPWNDPLSAYRKTACQIHRKQDDYTTFSERLHNIACSPGGGLLLGVLFWGMGLNWYWVCLFFDLKWLVNIQVSTWLLIYISYKRYK